MKTEIELSEDGILKEHNFETYNEVEEMFRESNKVAVVQATGTGKSFVAIQWLFDNCLMNNKRVLVLAPSYPIVRQFNKNMQDVGLDKDKAFSDMDQLIYPNLLTLSDEEFSLLKYDYIILDEFHRIGAEQWRKAVEKLLVNNEDAKVLGLSATPIRYLDNGRDMATELFGENVVEGLTLREGIEQGILPKAEYVTAVYSYGKTVEEIGKKIDKFVNKEKQEKFKNWLEKAKKRAEEAEGLEETFARKIRKKDSKLVVFCSDLAQIEEVKEKIQNGLFSRVNEKVKLYEVSYKNSNKKIEQEINEFENDNSENLKVMLSVDMFNEGLHVKDVDGCIMFRSTMSPRIYLQQIGRALSVGTDKIPIIFDVVNNIQSLKDIGEVFTEQEEREVNSYNMEDFLPFRIDGRNLELTKLLLRLDEMSKYYTNTAEDWLNSAQQYKDKHGNLKMTDSCEDEKGNKIGRWLNRVRGEHNRGKSTDFYKEVFAKLLQMDENVFKYTRKNRLHERDEKIVKFAKICFAKQRSLDIPKKKHIKDDVSGEIFDLGTVFHEFKSFLQGIKGIKVSKDLQLKLEAIDPKVFKYTRKNKLSERDAKIVKFAKICFEKQGDLNIPKRRNVADDISDEIFDLGSAICEFKRFLQGGKGIKISDELKRKLEEIDPKVFEYTREDRFSERDENIVKFAKIFFSRHGNLDIGKDEYVKDDVSKEEFNLGAFIYAFKTFLSDNKEGIKLSDDLKGKLEEIDPNTFKYLRKNKLKERDEKVVRFAQRYFKENGNLNISNKKNIKDDVSGESFNLGATLYDFKRFLNGERKGRKISRELQTQLEDIDSDVFKYSRGNKSNEIDGKDKK